jgi:hypothetical protein
VLAAGRGAEIQHALAGPRAEQQRHELRGLVLNGEAPARLGKPSAVDHERVRA